MNKIAEDVETNADIIRRRGFSTGFLRNRENNAPIRRDQKPGTFTVEPYQAQKEEGEKPNMGPASGANGSDSQNSSPPVFDKIDAASKKNMAKQPQKDPHAESGGGEGEGNDWLRWTLAGGSGLLAYALASSSDTRMTGRS